MFWKSFEREFWKIYSVRQEAFKSELYSIFIDQVCPRAFFLLIAFFPWHFAERLLPSRNQLLPQHLLPLRVRYRRSSLSSREHCGLKSSFRTQTQRWVHNSNKKVHYLKSYSYKLQLCSEHRIFQSFSVYKPRFHSQSPSLYLHLHSEGKDIIKRQHCLFSVVS